MNKRYLLVALVVAVGVAITAVSFYQCTDVHEQKTTEADVSTSTSLSVTQKSHRDDPDLVVSTKYVADINGQRVEAPVVSTVDQSTAKVTTEVNVTPLVKQMVPDWEIGVGVGYSNDDVYIPVSVQRNYKVDRAVSVEIHLDPDDRMSPCGVEVQHKWMF